MKSEFIESLSILENLMCFSMYILISQNDGKLNLEGKFTNILSMVFFLSVSILETKKQTVDL